MTTPRNALEKLNRILDQHGFDVVCDQPPAVRRAYEKLDRTAPPFPCPDPGQEPLDEEAERIHDLQPKVGCYCIGGDYVCNVDCAHP